MVEQKVLTEHITRLLSEKFTENEFVNLFLIEIKFNTSQNKLEVFVDSDTTLTLDQCAVLNRYLQHHIDENNWLGEKYTLDVSSPGVGKPLKLHRQYQKNIGRRLEVRLQEGKPQTGTLVSVDTEVLVLEQEKGKKKEKERIQITIPFDTIKQAMVKVQFTK